MEPFNPPRGIRQGDPLSPYTFILCMEFLGYLVEKKCSEGNWCPLKASWGNVGISHLYFTNDLILFAKVSNEACEAISDVLQEFCSESRQKISVKKSRIYFSSNVDPIMKEGVCDKLGMQATTCLGKYLGFPLKHKGVPRRQFNYIAERVMNKHAGWKAKSLSFGGKAVLVKSVMSIIPNHVIQGSTLPVHLWEKLDKINRDFLWGSTVEKRRIHLVGWDKLVKPKEEDGLGIQSARAKNIALLTKLNWKMYHEKEAI